MDKQTADSCRVYSGEVNVDKASVDDIHELLASRTTSDAPSASAPAPAPACQILHSENVHSLDALNSSSFSKGPHKPHSIGICHNAVRDRDQNVLFDQGNETSSVRKDDNALVTSSDYFIDANKDMKSTTTSISSSSVEGLEIPVDGQSAGSGSFNEQVSLEGNLGEAVLEKVDFSSRLDPSESSAIRDESSSSALSKGVLTEYSVEQEESTSAKMADLDIMNKRFNETSCVSVKPESGSDDDFLNSSLPTTNAHGPYDLVDVRVCDICGDVGREPLLALCSKCSDGAEHIYCMRIKMDKVPEGDWMCEDCMLLQEPKRRLVTQLERPDSALSPSYLKDISHGLPTIHAGVQRVSETKTKDYTKFSCSSAKRPVSDMELKTASKRRTLAKGIQPANSSHFGRKTPFTGVSSLKIMGKRKDRGSQLSSLDNQSVTGVLESTCPTSGHRSPKPRSDIKVRTAAKRIVLERSFQPLQSPGSRAKSLLTRVSSLKIMDKGEIPCFRVSSLSSQPVKKDLEQEISPSGHKSPKTGPHCQPLRSPSVSGKAQLTRVSSLRIMNEGEGAYFQVSSVGIQSPTKKVKRESSSSDRRSPNPESQFQILKSSSFSGKKLQLTQVPSLKMMDKGKVLPCRVSSVGIQSPKKAVEQAIPPRDRRSSKPESQCHAGSMCKSKLVNIADSNIVQQSHKDISKVKAINGADDHKLKKLPGKRLSKSMSFGGVNSVSAAFLSRTSSVKGLRYESERNLSKNKSAQLGLSSARFDAMVGNASGTKLVSKVDNRPRSSKNDVKNEKSIHVIGNSVFDALVSIACDGESNENRSAGESAQKAELGYPSKEIDGHVAVNKVQAVGCPMKDLRALSPIGVASPEISAVPESEATWKGAFQLEESGKLPDYCSGLQAHLSTYASPKVLELVPKFCPDLLLNEVPRANTWPVQFQKNCPTEQDIALYFFAEDSLSYARSYTALLEGMIRDDLALEANFDGVQLLVFPSSLLPVRSQRWNSLLFLWGVFRARKADSCSLRNLNAATSNQGLCAPVTYGALKRTLYPSEAGSFSTSHASDNSVKGPESVDPRVLQSSSLTKSTDQCFEHEVSSIEKCLPTQGEEDLMGRKDVSVVFGNGHSKKESRSDTMLHCNDFQKGGDTKFHSFSLPWSKAQNVASMREEKKLDIVGRSSFSVDSGPSGSSDGAGCVKSDEGQVEQFHDPSNCEALNLNLSLRPMVEPEGGQQVDLDLVLGSPSTNKYEVKHFSKDISSDHGNVSGFLSLGMPCSSG